MFDDPITLLQNSVFCGEAWELRGIIIKMLHVYFNSIVIVSGQWDYIVLR